MEIISGGECDSHDLDTALPYFIAAQAAMLSAPPTGATERRLARKFAKVPVPADSPAAGKATARRRAANPSLTQ